MEAKGVEKFIETKGLEELVVIFYVLDPVSPFKPLYFSPSIERFGYPVHQWYQSGADWSQFLHPEDREDFLASLLRMQSEKSKVSRYRMIGKDSRTYRIIDRACFVRDKDGKDLYIHGVLIDVTDWDLENLIRLGGDFYFRLFENVSDIVYLSDLNGRWILVNPAVEKVLGYSREEILTKLRMEDVVAPEYVQVVKQKLQEKVTYKSADNNYEVQFVRKDGALVTLEISSRLLWSDKGEPIAIQGIARDVTEKRKLIEDLSTSEREIKAILSALPELVFVVDEGGKLLKVPPTRNLKFFSANLEQLMGKSIENIVPSEHVDFFLLKIRESLRKSKPVSFESELKIDKGDSLYEIIFSPLDEKSVVMILKDITEKKFVMQALKESEERYRELFENANDLIYTHDLQGNYIEANQMAEMLTGYTKEEIKGLNFMQVVAPEHLERAKEAFRRKLKTGESTTYELDVITKNGQRITLELRTRLIYQNGKPVAVQGIGRDITERKRIERALKESEERYRLVTESVMHQIWVSTADGEVKFINSRVVEYFGCSLEDLQNGGWKQKVHPEDLKRYLRRMVQAYRKGETFEIEVRLQRKDGQYLWHLVRVVPYFDENGKVVKWFGTNTDIHEKKVVESRLNYLAKHDSLTGLINRSQFMEELREAIKKAAEDESFCFAILFLDLDRFKIINDTLGHSIGDEFLKIVAQRIKKCLRPRDLVARFGGDEFTILLSNFRSEENVFKVANRILEVLFKPFKVGSSEVFTSASIGIVFSDSQRKSPEDYLRDADTAMYRAKEKGRSGYEVFNHKMREQKISFLKLEADLRHSIDKQLFEIYYQPIVLLSSGEIEGFEALLRWKHPLLGLLSPEDFIDVAEETGLIVEIGNFVLETAFHQLRVWQKEFKKQFFICVNLSTKQLFHSSLVERVVQIINKNNLEPNSICLELTERAVLKDENLARRVLKELNEIGIELSADDFGTGYSSLGYLRNFPFKWLKIDKSFISELDSDKRSDLIVKAILMIGKGLSMKMIAEGIENEEQLQILRSYACQFGQGFLFWKPMDSKTVSKTLREASSFRREV